MRYLNLLRRPGPLLLWVGQVTSTAGDRLYMMAMLWLALQLTGSTQSMAAVSLFESIPLILAGLIGGALIDRRDRLRLMIGIDIIRGVLVLALPLLYLAGRLHPWHLPASIRLPTGPWFRWNLVAVFLAPSWPKERGGNSATAGNWFAPDSH